MVKQLSMMRRKTGNRFLLLGDCCRGGKREREREKEEEIVISGG